MRKYVIAIAIVALITIANLLNAQPPPPPPSGGHGSANNNPAGAPVGDGLGFLLVLSTFYGCARIGRMKGLKNNKSQDELR